MFFITERFQAYLDVRNLVVTAVEKWVVKPSRNDRFDESRLGREVALFITSSQIASEHSWGL